MSTNQHTPISDAPEPDVTQAGGNLIRAMIILMVLIGISWASLASLYKTALSEQRERISGAVTGSVATEARAASRARAQSAGVDELEDGTKVGYVPVARGAELLLANPEALRGESKWTIVETGDVAAIPALPSFAAVLDPAVAEAEAAEAGADEATDAAVEDDADAAAEDAGAEEAPAEAAE